MNPTREKNKTSIKKMKHILDKANEKADEARDFEVEKNGGYISFTKNFRYLGS